MAVVNLGARSYREGVVFFFDAASGEISTTDPGWAKKWEARSAARGKPEHIPGWNAGDLGSTLEEPDYMKLAGPWVGGKDPAKS